MVQRLWQVPVVRVMGYVLVPILILAGFAAYTFVVGAFFTAAAWVLGSPWMLWVIGAGLALTVAGIVVGLMFSETRRALFANEGEAYPGDAGNGVGGLGWIVLFVAATWVTFHWIVPR